MNSGLSTYLNLVRFLAAMAVLFCHASLMWAPGQFIYMVPYGQHAVLVFFVLSGYVIAWVADQKETNFGDYFCSRATRMYSVVVPALILTFALDYIGRHLMPDMYFADNGYFDKRTLRQAIRSLLFIGEVWGYRSVPGSNSPYWSLGYEVPYYAVYALLVFAPRGYRLLGALFVLGPFGHHVTLLFGVWLMGVATYRWGTKLKVPPRYAVALWLVSLIVLPMMKAYDDPVLYYQTDVRDYLVDYFLGFCVVANILGAYHMFAAYGDSFIARFRNVIDRLSGATFTIYLMHMPLGLFLAAAYGSHLTTFWPAMIHAACLLALLIVIAQFTEQHKGPWRRLFAGVVAKAESAYKSLKRAA